MSPKAKARGRGRPQKWQENAPPVKAQFVIFSAQAVYLDRLCADLFEATGRRIIDKSALVRLLLDVLSESKIKATKGMSEEALREELRRAIRTG